MAHDKDVLDFRVIAKPLDELLQATANIVRYQFPGKLPGNGADRILVMLMKVARIDYKSILHLCDEKAVNYRLEHAASIPPLSRCIADALFAAVFLLDDIEGNSRRYWRAGWRETCEFFRVALVKYGDNPERPGAARARKTSCQEYSRRVYSSRRCPAGVSSLSATFASTW